MYDYVFGHMIREHVQGQKIDTIGRDQTTCFYCNRFFLLWFHFFNKGVVPANGREKRENRINLSHGDIAKIREDSESEEVSENENHTNE
ncbi:hypothetical protein TNCT_49401 [Trichonephila clavata]|uniref:Uncharacterized protein n=1 Tax=Trichonephila clavata TaxID=2740835 RepID=A0A8X6IDE6_TRICU|nr:hypothetical protein TNCT_49401 [Trichonephila clavata]